MVLQIEITLKPKSRGFHLVTSGIMSQLPKLPENRPEYEHTLEGADDMRLCLAATEQGLATCWVCNFDANLCKELFSLSDIEEPAVIIPLGYAW